MSLPSLQSIFTPANFNQYIGQERVKTFAKVMVQAAKKENRKLPNILIDGGYGLGKTSLARVIYREFGLTPKVIDASSLTPNNVESIMPSFGTGIIIDEVHNLDRQVADSLNLLIDRSQLSIIACTTNSGDLSAPFKSRFRAIHLDPYTLEDISKIVDLVAIRKRVNLPYNQVKEIAKRSRLNPRIALSYLSTLFDVLTVKDRTRGDLTSLKEAFILLGVDDNGFLERDYHYLRVMPEDRAVGVAYLSSMLGLDSKTIETEIEPYLMQKGYIERTPRGRIKIKNLEKVAR